MTRRLLQLACFAGVFAIVGCMGTPRPVGPFAAELEMLTGLTRAADDMHPAPRHGKLRFPKVDGESETVETILAEPEPVAPPMPIAADDVTGENVYEKVQALKAEMSEASRLPVTTP